LPVQDVAYALGAGHHAGDIPGVPGGVCQTIVERIGNTLLCSNDLIESINDLSQLFWLNYSEFSSNSLYG